MKIDKSKFHIRLKSARRDAKLKQEQVARYLEIPISAVSAFEAGDRKVDALELFMLAKLYNKSVGWFYQDYTGDTALQANNMDALLMECLGRIKKVSIPKQRKIAYQIMTVLNEQ